MSLREDDVLAPEQRSVRRHSRRDLARLAVRIVAWLITLSFLSGIAINLFGGLIFAVHNRTGEFERVTQTGFDVAHPDLAILGRGSSRRGATWRYVRSVRVEREISTLAGPQQFKVRKSMNLFGRIGFSDVEPTPLDRALAEGRATRAQAEKFFADLPAAAVVDVVVDLSTPASPDDVEALLDRVSTRFIDPTVYFEDAFSGARRRLTEDGSTTTSDADAPHRSVAWNGHFQFELPGRVGGTVVDGFRAWAAALRPGDNQGLSALGLPSVKHIKRLADEGRVYSLYLRAMPSDTVRAMLRDPAVRTVTPVAVAFTILDRDKS